MGQLLERIKELEKRVAELESKGSSRNGKMLDVADWILSKFEKKEVYTVRRLFDLALKERGWKYQTLQIARRHMLEDKIGIEHVEGKGWCWVRMEE